MPYRNRRIQSNILGLQSEFPDAQFLDKDTTVFVVFHSRKPQWAGRVMKVTPNRISSVQRKVERRVLSSISSS